MLNNILSAAALRRIVTEVPDARLLPYGGPWGDRIPDRTADHRELTEFDRNIPPAADILATGAQSRDVADRPTEIVQNRAFRLKSSSRLTTSDLEVVMSVIGSNGTVARDRQALLGIARRHIERRLQSLRITRGILLSGMAYGDLSWGFGGIVTGSIDFGMPATMKLVPSVYWLDNAGAFEALATPVSDMISLDQEAAVLGGLPFTDVDMAQAIYTAMIQTTEYQNQAKALSSVYQVGSLPVDGSAAALELASRVLGKRIHIVDHTYEYEDMAGDRISGRYVPQKYVVLYRDGEARAGAAASFANVPVTESAVAAIAGAGNFGGDVVRGPIGYTTHDNQDFGWVRMHGTQEGVPERNTRTVTARILAEEPV